jgi:Na+/H+-dicarboxylate symporter
VENSNNLSRKILIALGCGAILGLILSRLPWPNLTLWLDDNVFQLLGQLFINLLKMLVVPVVFASLTASVSSLAEPAQLGRIGGKAVILYLITTAVAITIAITLAESFNIGAGANLHVSANFNPGAAPSARDIIIDLFPSNPIAALANGNMLQIIVFSLLLGLGIASLGDKARTLKDGIDALDKVMLHLVGMVMKLAPLGVFCLLTSLFARTGFALIAHLAGYFIVVLLALLVQWAGLYSLMLKLLAKINPLTFFRAMLTPIAFAFSVASSSASIPIVLKTVEEKLGVKNKVASLIIPLGATINMDGTAIMQGVATVFIAHAYAINIGISGYLTVIAMATLASVGTAGVPGIGLITLAMVLKQVHLPVAGIALIIGVDRLLDMARTAVNISGDAMIACIINKSESK